MQIKIKRPKKYNIILADPPWTWKAWSEKGTDRSASKHYTLLNNQAIKSLPVHKLAATNCVLFLWVTFPLLEVGLETVKAWGFTYKTVAFSWAKTTKHGKWHMGNGYYTRANVEICLLATRGNPWKASSAVRQLIVAPATRHSAKPLEIKSRIVDLLGDVPRIELFAREQTDGWDATGIELDGKDIREVLK